MSSKTITVEIDPRVINKAYFPFMNCDVRTQIFFGGSSSGKSVFLAQRLVSDMLSGGRNYLVMRNVSNTMRTSVYNEIMKVIQAWRVEHMFFFNRSDMMITCRNGYQVIFKGLDNVQKIKSITPSKGQLTDIWIEEATETTYDDVKELTKRLRGPSKVNKRVILSFNPIMRTHWIYREFFQGNWHDGDMVFKSDNLLILKTTYKDNAYLSEQDVYELENEKDEYYYNVYTLGNWGTLGSLVFKNWCTEDLSDRRDLFSTYKHGLDFGFTNDPTAYVRTARSGNILYITHSLYGHGFTNDVIARELLLISPQLRLDLNGEIVQCDAAEPKSIHELRQYKVNAIAANKGPGSLNYGIQLLKQYEQIIVHRELQEVINEFELYQWQKNRDGEIMNIPVDRNNHAMDAIRYSESDRLYEMETQSSGVTALGIF